jgi:hypothetical protein
MQVMTVLYYYTDIVFLLRSIFPDQFLNAVLVDFVKGDRASPTTKNSSKAEINQRPCYSLGLFKGTRTISRYRILFR